MQTIFPFIRVFISNLRVFQGTVGASLLVKKKKSRVDRFSFREVHRKLSVNLFVRTKFHHRGSNERIKHIKMFECTNTTVLPFISPLIWRIISPVHRIESRYLGQLFLRIRSVSVTTCQFKGLRCCLTTGQRWESAVCFLETPLLVLLVPNRSLDALLLKLFSGTIPFYF